MKRLGEKEFLPRTTRIITIFFTIVIFAISGIHLYAQVTVSGVLESSVSMRAGAADSPAFSYGVEEYANLRIQAKLKDRAAVYGAVNLTAAAGDYAAAAAGAAELAGFGSVSSLNTSSYVYGENYVAGIELERLYFRLQGEYTGFDGGLLRLPFGYGQAFRPSDFLNPPNPLQPDARPRAVLGAGFFWYPSDSLKLLCFGAVGKNPLERSGEGSLAGISMDRHWNRASLQALYAFETPKPGAAQGVHRAGISVKADLELGLALDALYAINSEAGTKADGLSFNIGADYSFFEGRLVVLAEYLYNGAASSTAAGYGGGFSNENYLYSSLTWSFNDYTNITAAMLSSFDDVSFTPLVILNHDLFQGVTLTISAQFPLDRSLFSDNGGRGELGSIPPDTLQPHDPETGAFTGRFGRYADFSAKLRLRF
jgi:hypothetical protein